MSAAAAMAAAADFGSTRPLTISVGGEYQVISQEYYRLAFDTVSVDIIENWSLKTDAINDFILKTNLGYATRNHHNRFDLKADLELSGDRFLGRGDGAYRIGSTEHNLKAAGSIEAKAPLEGDEDWVEGYTYIQGYLQTEHQVVERVELRGKIGYELTTFSESDTAAERNDTTFISTDIDIYPNYDYGVFGSSLGGKFLLSEFGHEIGWEARYRHRQVPDSSLADYDQVRFGLDYSYFDLSTYIAVFSSIEVKEYIRPEDEDDFAAWEFNALATRQIGSGFEMALSVFVDLYRFDKTDIVNRDYHFALGELKGLLRFGAVKAGPLARAEFRRSEDVDGLLDLTISDEYNQWETGIYSEMLHAADLYFLGELTVGRREYLRETELLTDYFLISPSILATWSFYRVFSLNLLFDGAFERHREITDNSSLYLLSIGLTARF